MLFQSKSPKNHTPEEKTPKSQQEGTYYSYW